MVKVTVASKSGGGGGGKDAAKKKKTSKKKTGPNAVVTMKHKAPAPNPFETIWSRTKFEVIGKKRKGAERRVGLSRSLAIEKRNNTLLKEYQQSSKASEFVDKRIGEQNQDLAEFDKAILRSQRERQMKLSKKSLYNLSDGEEEDEMGFTFNLGQDDFINDVEPEEEEENYDDPHTRKPNSSKKMMSDDAHNTFDEDGGEGEETRSKTRKEVMEEIIRKSKYHKAQKSMAKEENEELMIELDKDFRFLMNSKSLLSLTQPSKMNAVASNNIQNAQIKKEVSTSSLREGIVAQNQADAYEKILKTMQLEMRARPSDRIKTPEEIAQEERERLEELEEDRQRRMLATDESSDEELEHECEKHSSQHQRPISGDHDYLGDAFDIDEKETTKGWVDAILERRESGDDESEDSESSQDTGSEEDDIEGDSEDDVSEEDSGNYPTSLSLKDWEQNDDDENLLTDSDEGVKESMNDERDSKKQIGDDAVGKKKQRTKFIDDKKRPLDKTESLPFTIEAPGSFEELSSLLDNRTDEDVVEAIKRIRKCNAIVLKAENRKKYQVFYGLLLQYYAVSANKKPLNLKKLNLLASPLMEMSSEIPYFAAICARQRLMRTRTQLCEALKNQDKSCWPSTKTLFLLRLWSIIYPCSDFRHVVLTPATLLMCEYLMRCPIVSGRDIAIGMLLCAMVLSVAKLSEKLYPEALMFIRTMLMAAKKETNMSSHDPQVCFLIELKSPRPLLYINDRFTSVKLLDFLMLMELPDDSPFFDSNSFRAGIMTSIIETLRGFATLYNEFCSFPELFLPLSKLVLEIADEENMPKELEGMLKDVGELITKKIGEHSILRKPLQMLKQKQVAIKLLNPSFEESYNKGRDYDPDRERAEARRLKKQIKQETKGAVRELRKDNHFLVEVKAKDRALHGEERKEKLGKARAFLEEQEHAFKSGQLGKSRKGRR